MNMIYVNSIREIILLTVLSFVEHTANMNLLSLGCGGERLRRRNHSAHPGMVPIAGLQGFEELLGHAVTSPVNLEDCHTHFQVSSCAPSY